MLSETLRLSLDRPDGDPRLRCLALLHGAAMIGRFDAVEALAALAPARGVEQAQLDEAALQVVAFAGFPRAIEALGRLAAVRGGAAAGSALDERSLAALEADGRATWSRIYRHNDAQVLAELDDLLPGFDLLVLRNAYGSILSRPGLELGVRELLALAALALAALERPLGSHIRGALHNGFSVAEVQDILLTCTVLASADARVTIDQAHDRLSRNVYSR